MCFWVLKLIIALCHIHLWIQTCFFCLNAVSLGHNAYCIQTVSSRCNVCAVCFAAFCETWKLWINHSPRTWCEDVSLSGGADWRLLVLCDSTQSVLYWLHSVTDHHGVFKSQEKSFSSASASVLLLQNIWMKAEWQPLFSRLSGSNCYWTTLPAL